MPPAPPNENKKPARPPKPRRIPRKVSKDWLHNAGLYYLQRFAASTSQFKTVMTRKIDRSCRHHPDQDREQCLELLNQVIADFMRSGLLNDSVYAESAINSLRRRGYARRHIEMRLSRKGLAHDVIREKLELIDEQNNDNGPDAGNGDMRSGLLFARRKKIGPYAAPVAAELRSDTRKKHLAALGRAGYDYETASKIADMDRQAADDYLTQDQTPPLRSY